MMRRLLILTFTALLMLTAVAQKTAVSGTVVSRADGGAVAGATVTADGAGDEGLAVVTNSDGFFTLKADSMPRAITVSFLGYRSQRVDLSRHSSPLTIRLQPTSIRLNEVVIMAEDPRQLVSDAIGKIGRNYSAVPELYHCFYRETAMKRQHYICVAEGVVDMYKTPYSRSVTRDRVAIRKGRRLLSPKRSDTLSVKVLGGPVGPVLLDVVKNRDFLLNEADLDCYDMKMETPQSIADRQQYVVSLTPRRVMPWALYYGRLYIDVETRAFTRADLTLDMSSRERATQMMLVRKPAGVRFRPKEMSLLVDYRYEDGVTRISYIRSTFRFNCDWRRRLLATAFTATCEMVVTSRTSSNVAPIRGRESFDARDAFFDKVEYFRDTTFWRDYNIIEPTETLDRAIGRIMRKYNR